MKYRKLGQTGLKVSEISLGSWLTYGGYIEEDAAVSSIHRAYELGINFFDTANVYMRGEAEKVVGKALQGFPRESYVLATKVYFPMGDGPNDRGLSRKHIIEQCNASLKRLGTDYIDLYYCHRFDSETPLEETLRALEDLINQGKVLYIGFSEWSASQIAEAVQTQDRLGFDRFVASQPQYNLLVRRIEEEVLPLSERYGIGQVVWSPLAQGMLTGKYKRDQAYPKGSRATDPTAGAFIQKFFNDETFTKVEKLQEVAKKLDLSLAQLALAWVLRLPGISSALIGASRPQQVEENVKAVDVVLPSEILSEIEDILAETS